MRPTRAPTSTSCSRTRSPAASRSSPASSTSRSASGGRRRPATVTSRSPGRSRTRARAVPKLDINASFEGGGQSMRRGHLHRRPRFRELQRHRLRGRGPDWKQFTASYEQAAERRAATSRWPRSASTRASGSRTPRTPARPRSATPTRSRSPATSTCPSCSTTSTPRWTSSARSAAPARASLPEQLTAEQKQQAVDAIKDLSVEIYTGAEDKILRRIVVAMRSTRRRASPPAPHPRT